MHLIFELIGALVALTTYVAEAIAAAVHAVSHGLHLLHDVVHARHVILGGALRCPQGHEVRTTGGPFSCTACGFQWEGPNASIWLCPNPNCTAPVTPYCNCPTCGASVLSPWRWGKP